jgi:cell division septation protein DedD
MGQSMAESYFEDFSASEPAARLEVVQTTMRWGVAVVSVALVMGLGVWTYRLMVRDVSGVPVVHALAGLGRIAPDDPGGQQAAHQGLSVNRVAALGEAAAPADRVVLAPRPIRLAEEDRPMDAVTRAEHRIEAEAPPVVLASLRTTDPAAPADLADPVPDTPGALAAEAASQTRALSEEPGTSGVFGSALDAALAEALGVKGSILRSPRPLARPKVGAGADDRIAALDAPIGQVENLVAETPATLAPEPVIDPENLAPGTRLVQLGAFDDAEKAGEAWERLQSRFGAYLEGRQPVIQAAESNGRSFVRLRALGFADEGDARRFCATLLAEDTSCIPVMIR